MKTDTELFDFDLVLGMYIDLLREFKKDYQSHYLAKRLLGDTRKNTLKKALIYREASCEISATYVKLGTFTTCHIPA